MWTRVVGALVVCLFTWGAFAAWRENQSATDLAIVTPSGKFDEVPVTGDRASFLLSISPSDAAGPPSLEAPDRRSASGRGNPADAPSNRPSRREILVVSSLGDSASTYRVRLTATPVETMPSAAGDVPRRQPIRHQADPWEQGTVASGSGCNSGRSPTDRRGPSPIPVTALPPQRSLPALAGDRSSPKVGDLRLFHLRTAGELSPPSEGYVTFQSRVVRLGREVAVYLDEQQAESELSPGWLDEIVRLLDEDLIPILRPGPGTWYDVDHDHRLAVVITPWLGKLCDGRTAVAGLVCPADFRSGLPAPYSNACDVLYLNPHPPANGPALRTLLAHEYTHVVCCGERRRFHEQLADSAGVNYFDEEDWLNEAIAHVGENLAGADRSNIAHRVHSFFRSPQTSPLVVADYFRAGLWRDEGCRGATYQFLHWCVERYGTDLLRRLIRSPARGCRNLEDATGVPFPELYRAWTMSLAMQGAVAASTSNGAAEADDLAPRMVRWTVDSPVCELGLRGTSTAYVQLTVPGEPTSGEPRNYRVDVQGTDGMRLQLTWMAVPNARPITLRSLPRSFWRECLPTAPAAILPP